MQLFCFYSLVEWSNTNAIFIVKSNNKEIIIAWSHNMAHPKPKFSVLLPQGKYEPKQHALVPGPIRHAPPQP